MSAGCNIQPPEELLGPQLRPQNLNHLGLDLELTSLGTCPVLGLCLLTDCITWAGDSQGKGAPLGKELCMGVGLR